MTARDNTGEPVAEVFTRAAPPDVVRALHDRLLSAGASEAATLLVLTGMLALALSIGAGSVSLIAIGILLTTNWVGSALGATLVSHLGLASPRAAPWPVCWLTGILALCLLVLAVSLMLNVTAGVAWVISMVLCALPVIREPSATREAAAAWSDFGAVALVSATTMVWSWRAIHAVPDLLLNGTFSAWSDYFIHAGEIAQFANLAALHGSSIFAAGAGMPLYHYAGYMLPAAVASLAGVPALVCVTALWTPLGLLVLGTGAFSLGNELAGRAGALAAIAAVLLLPDAAWYGLKNPIFDFHWLLQISSSGAFALGLAMLALTFLQRWVTHGRPAIWAAAALLTLLVAPFRVHIAAVLIPTVVLASLCYWRARLRWKVWAVGGLGGLAMIAVMIAESIPRAPHFWSDPINPMAVLQELHASQPSSYAGLYHAATAALPPWLTLPLGMGLLLPAAFGIMVSLYFGLLPVSPRRGNALPAMALTVYLTIVLVFPVTPLEPGEFQHRPFVLVYAMLAIWSAAMLLRWSERLTQAAPRMRWIGLLVLLLLPFPLLLAPWAQQSRLDWGPVYAATVVPAPLRAMAAEIRLRSPPGAVMAVPRHKEATALLALAERAVFFPGEDFMRIQSGLDTTTLQAREAVQNDLLAAPSLGEFRRVACANGISLVAAFPDTNLPPEIMAAAGWQQSGYAVIEITCPAAR